jgi:hypothetical protein
MVLARGCSPDTLPGSALNYPVMPWGLSRGYSRAAPVGKKDLKIFAYKIGRFEK